jgi:hypothetical protein
MQRPSHLCLSLRGDGEIRKFVEYLLLSHRRLLSSPDSGDFLGHEYPFENSKRLPGCTEVLPLWPRLKRVLDHVQRLVEERAQPLAMWRDQLSNENARAGSVCFPARPGARHAELPRDRRRIVRTGRRSRISAGSFNDVKVGTSAISRNGPFVRSVNQLTMGSAVTVIHRAAEGTSEAGPPSD